MDIFEAIRDRRTIGRVKPDIISDEVVGQLLEAATWAPNHYRTEPWKFIIMKEKGKQAFHDIAVQISLDKLENPTEEEREQLLKKHKKHVDILLLLVVACVPSDNPRAILEEEIAASHAAVQNLLLAAHALGLGAVWRANPSLVNHPKVKELFKLREIDQVVRLIYLGYREANPERVKRTPYEEKTLWLDQEV
ncbi:nitroreductase family protein [Paenibacillus larvae]|uniref:nitroreductase family protein n=1 Tax=Paenibacillus larvae TaxID=1464 RepID=UPI0001695225|nr:nitroreductase family protein [Paenibacillus larvae]